jgi:hypothetical protein
MVVAIVAFAALFYAPICFCFLQLLATKSCCGLPNAQLSASFYKIRLAKTIQNQHKHN